MVTINIKKKDLYLITAIFVFIIATGFVIAYGGTTPSVMGHSAGEVSGTVTGGCYITCDQTSVYVDTCTNSAWGTGSCVGQAGWGSAGNPCPNYCVCAAGTQKRSLGVTQSWGPNYGFNAMQNTFICVTS